MKTKVGITGQSGFIGTHLFNFLRLKSDIERVEFNKSMFDNKKLLADFVSKCDAIVHLAGMSRGNDQRLVYDTNMLLVKKLLESAEISENKPHLLFASTSHEFKETPYHASKRDGRAAIDKWAEENDTKATGLIMPNVFGPYCKPYFNSFIATFCHQAARGETPEVKTDSTVQLIHIDTLCAAIYNAITDRNIANPLTIPHEFEIKVSEVKMLLENFRNMVTQNNKPIIFYTIFEQRLFNTFLSYLDSYNGLPD